MMTNTATADSLRQHAATGTTAQKVVIVNGSPEVLEQLETVLDAGRYDVAFVQSSERAYSQIKRAHPDLVVLCVRMNEGDGFQVLSMLKLDDETRAIPVLTCTCEERRDESEEEYSDPSGADLFPAPKAAIRMN